MDLSKYDILSNSELSFKFKFHNKKDKNLKKIASFDNILDSDYDIIVTDDTCVLKTCVMPYVKAKYCLAAICKKLSEKTSVKWDDALSVNISFPQDILSIYQINALKLALCFDENKVYGAFPDRKNRIGSRSVSELVKSGATQDSLRSQLCSDMYGINLSDLGNNVISFNYIGGENYADKYLEISNIIDNWILTVYSTVKNPEYTQDEISKLSKLSKADTQFSDIFVSPDTFKKQFSDVNILVDLSPLEGKENIFWGILKDKLHDLFKSFKNHENIKMTLNYDTDAGRMQIKNSKIYGVYGLENVDLIDCTVSGDISRVSLYYSNLVNTNADFCDFFNSCEINKSRLSNCYISDTSVITDTVITGDSTVMSGGTLKDCTLDSGVKYTKDTKIKNCVNNATKI